MGLRRYINRPSGAAEKVRQPLPAGLLFAIPHAGAVPEGTLLCNGSSYNKRRYPELHRALRNAYGSDVGATAVLPDFRGRSPLGVNGSVGGLNSLGANDGLAVGSRTPRHAHSTANHDHGGMDHAHTSPSHNHAGESHSHALDSHQHGIPAHGHGISGTSANTTGKPAEPGPHTVADNTHNHGAGSLSLSSVTPAPTGASSGGQSGQAAHATFGSTVPNNTGAASAATTGLTTGDDVEPTDDIGFAAVQWVITHGRPKTKLSRLRRD